MNRAERRYRTYRAARRRQIKNRWEDQPIGRFRKWNGTCQCRYCQMEKYYSIQLQRWKDQRRNGNFEIEAD
jgi:hypothetical protein